MDDRLQAIRERVEKATPGPWHSNQRGYCGRPVYNVTPPQYTDMGSMSGEDADFIAHSRSDIEFLLAKLDQAGKLAEDLEMLTDQKGEIGSFLKTRFPASLRIAQDSLDAWKGTPTPPEAKCEHSKCSERIIDGKIVRSCPDCEVTFTMPVDYPRCKSPDPMMPLSYCDRKLPCSIHGAKP